MAITDGTQTTTPQVPNTPPEIKLNLNFDKETSSGETPSEKVITKEGDAPQASEAPMFLRVDAEPTSAPIGAPTSPVVENSAPQQAQEPTTQAADAWLAQEDALVKKTEEVTVPETNQTQNKEAPLPQEKNPLERSQPAQTVPESTLEQQTQTVIPEVSIPTPAEEKPQQIEMPAQEPISTNTTVAENVSQMSLQEDMKIIQDLGSKQATPVVQETQTNTLNLDTLLQDTPAPQVPTPQVTPVPQAVAPTEAVVPQAAATVPFLTEEKKTKGTKILLFVLLFVGLGAVGFFMFKTMFPVEYAGIITLPTGGNQVMPIEAPVLTTGDILGSEILTGNTTNGDILSGGTVATDTSGQSDTSGQHGSANDAMFSDLQDLGADLPSSDSLISKLHTFAEQGAALFERAKASNNIVGIKFGGYIRNKATSLANSLASGEQLDTQMVQNYLAQFSGYLSQLQSGTNETNTQGPTEVSPSLSGDAPSSPQNSGFSGSSTNTGTQ